uniref:Uncharacterized protein n=1 Tax=Arundo donax TaxID=35708 RepID=A0A0A8YUA5_ARUDO
MHSIAFSNIAVASSSHSSCFHLPLISLMLLQPAI